MRGKFHFVLHQTSALEYLFLDFVLFFEVHRWASELRSTAFLLWKRVHSPQHQDQPVVFPLTLTTLRSHQPSFSPLKHCCSSLKCLKPTHVCTRLLYDFLFFFFPSFSLSRSRARAQNNDDLSTDFFFFFFNITLCKVGGARKKKKPPHVKSRPRLNWMWALIFLNVNVAIGKKKGSFI